MELKYSKIVSREERKAEMMLYGELGDEAKQIDGHYFANELNWLGRNYDVIVLRVNSGGGRVAHGFSIFSQLVTSPAKVIVQVDGIAASMAAIFLAAADEVHLLDYARVMLHSPFYTDKEAKNLSATDKKVLKLLRGSLVTMLAKRGIDNATAETYITAEDKWFTAEEALEAKLADKIITTGKKKVLAKLDYQSLAAQVNELSVESNNLEMKQLIAKFQLPETAVEADVMNAVSKLEQDHTTAVASLQERNDKLVAKLLEIGKTAGTITAENEANFKKLATTDIELFASMITVKKEDLDASGTRLSDVIAKLEAAATGQQGKADDKDFEWYEKNDPQALAQMKAKDPEKYQKLKAADDAKYQ